MVKFVYPLEIEIQKYIFFFTFQKFLRSEHFEYDPEEGVSDGVAPETPKAHRLSVS